MVYSINVGIECTFLPLLKGQTQFHLRTLIVECPSDIQSVTHGLNSLAKVQFTYQVRRKRYNQVNERLLDRMSIR